jgi:hypothetical protein
MWLAAYGLAQTHVNGAFAAQDIFLRGSHLNHVFYTVSKNILACYTSEEEQKLLAKQEAGDNSDALGARLNEIYEELHITGADSAESRVWAGGGAG